MRDERGYTLPELLIGTTMALIVIFAAMTLLTVAQHSTARTASRIDANQQARPVMDRIMDDLRSTCLERESVPILAGSTDSTISFLNQTGNSVSPVPDKHTVTYASGSLTERVYPGTTEDSAGVWSFQSTASQTSTLLSSVGQATVNGATVPVFQYYGYGANGVISTTPFTATSASPLSTLDAANTVQVTVSFSANPLHNGTNDPQAAADVSDSALLRFGPPSELSAGTNLPCT
jgi:Tfp pilus assembly protein PilW